VYNVVFMCDVICVYIVAFMHKTVLVCRRHCNISRLGRVTTLYIYSVMYFCVTV
jgi:hypothetical protein